MTCPIPGHQAKPVIAKPLARFQPDPFRKVSALLVSPSNPPDSAFAVTTHKVFDHPEVSDHPGAVAHPGICTHLCFCTQQQIPSPHHFFLSQTSYLLLYNLLSPPQQLTSYRLLVWSRRRQLIWVGATLLGLLQLHFTFLQSPIKTQKGPHSAYLC